MKRVKNWEVFNSSGESEGYGYCPTWFAKTKIAARQIGITYKRAGFSLVDREEYESCVKGTCHH